MKSNLLLWWVVGKLDTLLDVALETSVACLEKLLLVVVDLSDRVDGLFSTVGLVEVRLRIVQGISSKLTPSRTGTEKKSHPVALATSSPPGTPER